MSRLVYLPTGTALATSLRDGGAAGSWLGFTVSAGLRGQLAEGSGTPSDDECEYAALNAAALAQLLDPRAVDSRLVLAAEVDEAQVSDVDSAGPGTATVADLRWRQVIAVFADEAAAAEAVAAARAALRNRPAVHPLAVAEVVALNEEFDLLWYAPEELG